MPATVPNTEKRIALRVTGMDCASCATKIETALRQVPELKNVVVSPSASRLSFETIDADKSIKSATKVVQSLGYGISQIDTGDTDHAPTAPHHHVSDDEFRWSSAKVVTIIACSAALIIAYLVGQVRPDIAKPFFLAGLAVGLVPIAQRAVAAAWHGTPFSIEMLMTIAAVGAVVIGATEEAAVVVLLFLVGEILEGYAARRARDGIRALTSLVPKSAFVESDDGVQEVPADSLKVGTKIVVRPGDRIPADGIILEGESSINEAPVTGESVPKRKAVGDLVFAGTVNTDAVLRVNVTAAAADNTIARVVRLVEEAQEAKAPTQRFIDRFSRYYTPAVLLLGILVAIVPPLFFNGEWGGWIYKGLAVLLIGCPCALVISTPAAIAAGLSSGARRGLLIKGGAVLETIGKVTTIAMDKTGTLTEGRPVVTDVLAVSVTSERLMSVAAALETGSSHPLAKAILTRAAREKVPNVTATEVRAVNGKGMEGVVEERLYFLGSPSASAARGAALKSLELQISQLNAEGKTVSVLLQDQAVHGLIAMRDEPRPDAVEGVKRLKARGIATVMLTGDNRQTAAAVARALGMEAHAELLPEDKLKIIEGLQRSGQTVAKVGDGINDAPALAAADVGIAMGGGTDVALETADAALLNGRINDLSALVDLSRSTMTNISQNIAVSLGLKGVFLVTTILGVTGLWPAILADTGATVLVTMNALRLLRTGAAES